MDNQQPSIVNEVNSSIDKGSTTIPWEGSTTEILLETVRINFKLYTELPKESGIYIL